jgi:hypothetical protein
VQDIEKYRIFLYKHPIPISRESRITLTGYRMHGWALVLALGGARVIDLYYYRGSVNRDKNIIKGDYEWLV